MQEIAKTKWLRNYSLLHHSIRLALCKEKVSQYLMRHPEKVVSTGIVAFRFILSAGHLSPYQKNVCQRYQKKRNMDTLFASSDPSSQNMPSLCHVTRTCPVVFKRTFASSV